MREIKFKAKTSDGEWVEGFYLEIEYCDGQGMCSYIKQHGSAPEKVIPESVCQFTGLTDKNGKEVYEGDIISIGKTSQSRYIVYWSKMDAWFRTRYEVLDERLDDNDEIETYWRERFKHSLSGALTPSWNNIVIGNIHDKTEER